MFWLRRIYEKKKKKEKKFDFICKDVADTKMWKKVLK